MSTSASSPSQSQRGLFAINEKLIPVVSALFALVVLGTVCMCTVSAINRRRLRRIANDPRTIAMAREQARLKEEREKGPPTPRMKTVNVEVDLEIGEPGEAGWKGVTPLSLELAYDPNTSPPPYSDDGSKLPPTPAEEAKYVRLTVLVALPSASGRRHRRDDVVLEATLADAQGRPLDAVQSVQPYLDQYAPLPEMSMGVYQQRWEGPKVDLL